jgi:hypothetical protein
MRKLLDELNESFIQKLEMEQTYRDYISRLATKRTNEVFLNSSAAHASIVLSNIFQQSENCVKMFAGNLKGEVSNNPQYIDSIVKFLRRNGKLQILLEEYDTNNPPEILERIRFYKNKNLVSIKTHPYELTISSGQKIHFSVGDNKMYRLETDVDKYLAEGNFGDASTAKFLSDKFDEIFNKNESQEINL